MRSTLMAQTKTEYRFVRLELRVEKLSEISKRQLEKCGIYSLADGEKFVAFGIIDNLRPFSFLSKTHPEVKHIEFDDPPNAK